MARSRKGWWLALLALAVVSGLTGCKKGPVADDPQRDRQTEAQREHYCADPQWKAANLGLWYNMCSGGGSFRPLGDESGANAGRHVDPACG